jgi:hypothetical protein
MDLTNRILAVGVALLWIFLILVVILLAWGAPDQSIDRIADLAGYLEDHNSTGAKLVVTFGGLVLVLLGVIVVLLEVAPPETGDVAVASVGSGDVRIGTDEISQRLQEELRVVPHVSGIQATVVGRGRKAEVKLDLYVSPEADLAATTDEACRRARELLEGRMGVELDSPPKALVHYRELEVRARTGPAAPQPGLASASPGPSTEQSHEAASTTHEDRPAGG